MPFKTNMLGFALRLEKSERAKYIQFLQPGYILDVFVLWTIISGLQEQFGCDFCNFTAYLCLAVGLSVCFNVSFQLSLPRGSCRRERGFGWLSQHLASGLNTTQML